jgi:RNA polymerase sigma-70 factor (ECF subfamily)
MIVETADANIVATRLRFARNCRDATEGAMRPSPPEDSLATGWTHLAASVDRSAFGNGMVAMDDPHSDAWERTEQLSGCIVRIASVQDEAAFETLFRHFAPRLKSYFTKRRCDPATAEEITQEAMVAVWKNAAQFDPAKASAATWIFTIARNLGIDRFRQARRPAFDPNDPAFIPEDEESPDRQLERAEAEQTIRELMDSLSPNEKSVLMLSFYEDRSHGEIAERLGLPVGTVKSRIRLAFGKLRAALDPQAGAGS